MVPDCFEFGVLQHCVWFLLAVQKYCNDIKQLCLVNIKEFYTSSVFEIVMPIVQIWICAAQKYSIIVIVMFIVSITTIVIVLCC